MLPAFMGSRHKLKNYFGDGSDSEVTISTDINLSAIQDGAPVVKHYSSLTVNSGVTLTTDNRCQGLLIYVSGDCTINGTITMTARGGSGAPGEKLNLFRALSGGSSLTGDTPNTTAFPNETMLGGPHKNEYEIPIIGASGGAGQTGTGDGADGSDGQTAGGGGGGAANSADGGDGAAGTAYGGGAGGGGDGHGWNSTVYPGEDAVLNGGKGGDGGNGGGNANGGGGGAGNPGGAGGTGASGVGQNGFAGETGIGGVLFLIVGGDLTLGASAVISSNGSNGGNGGQVAGGANAGGGAGSGGGSVVILHAGSLTNSGATITASGGAGGQGTSGINNGGAGGAGTVQGPISVNSA